jgi:hypothetical protein
MVSPTHGSSVEAGQLVKAPIEVNAEHRLNTVQKSARHKIDTIKLKRGTNEFSRCRRTDKECIVDKPHGKEGPLRGNINYNKENNDF